MPEFSGRLLAEGLLLKSFVTLLFFSAPAVLACSCVGNSTPCSALKGTSTVFLGRVVRDTGEGLGTRTALMEVVEVFHGVAQGVREVEVSSNAGSSCYMPLSLGKTYVIFGRQSEASPIIQNLPCTGSFMADGREGLVEALREAEHGGSPNLVGKVSIARGRYEEDAPGAGIRVLARQRDTELAAVTGPNGEFRFAGVATGAWSLRLDSPTLFDNGGSWGQSEVTVTRSGCALTSLRGFPDGQIRGVVRNSTGKPVVGVSVEAFEWERNDFSGSAARGALTDSKGQYVIHGLPSNRYLVGVNGSKYEYSNAYPPVFFPGSGDRNVASPINLAQLETRDGIDLVLRAPREWAQVVVEFVAEEGAIAAGSISARDSSGLQRGYARGDSGKVEGSLKLNLWAGESYTLDATAFRSRLILRGRLENFTPISGENSVRITLR